MPQATALSKHGLANADALVRAASKTGLPLHIAAAFAQQESNGLNVYGHDVGGVFSVKGKNIEVTAENYAIFYDQVVNRKRRSNGVGPMQITYPGYFPLAKKQGFKLWDPYDNFVFGFNIIQTSLKNNYSDDSLNRAAQQYNSGSPSGAPSYGSSVVARSKTWKKILANVPVTSPALGISGVYPLPVGEYFGVDDGTPKSHSGVRGKDSDIVKKIQREVGTDVDGSFGPKTKARVKTYQSQHNLEVDGKVGPLTWSQMTKTGIR